MKRKLLLGGISLGIIIVSLFLKAPANENMAYADIPAPAPDLGTGGGADSGTSGTDAGSTGGTDGGSSSSSSCAD